MLSLQAAARIRMDGLLPMLSLYRIRRIRRKQILSEKDTGLAGEVMHFLVQMIPNLIIMGKACGYGGGVTASRKRKFV